MDDTCLMNVTDDARDRERERKEILCRGYARKRRRGTEAARQIVVEPKAVDMLLDEERRGNDRRFGGGVERQRHGAVIQYLRDASERPQLLERREIVHQLARHLVDARTILERRAREVDLRELDDDTGADAQWTARMGKPRAVVSDPDDLRQERDGERALAQGRDDLVVRGASFEQPTYVHDGLPGVDCVEMSRNDWNRSKAAQAQEIDSRKLVEARARSSN